MGSFVEMGRSRLQAWCCGSSSNTCSGCCECGSFGRDLEALLCGMLEICTLLVREAQEYIGNRRES
jgi:hypothetical protein